MSIYYCSVLIIRELFCYPVQQVFREGVIVIEIFYIDCSAFGMIL